MNKYGLLTVLAFILAAGTSFGYESMGNKVNAFCAEDPYTGDCTLCHTADDPGAATEAKTAAGKGVFCFFCPDDPSCMATGAGGCTDADGDGYPLQGDDCGIVDCNDLDPAANPGAAERCDDLVDNNCDGVIDGLDTAGCPAPENCTDADQDGYFAEGNPCGTARDCNDSNGEIHPGAMETCDGMDGDCDGQVDEGCGEVSSDGSALYVDKCASCHGELPASDVCGASTQQLTRAIAANRGGMARLCSLTNIQASRISEALSECKIPPGTDDVGPTLPNDSSPDQEGDESDSVGNGDDTAAPQTGEPGEGGKGEIAEEAVPGPSKADPDPVVKAARELSVTFGAFGADLAGTAEKWWGGVRGPDNRIYGIPFNSPDLLIIDPATNAVTRSAMGETLDGSAKWAGGCLGPDGKIYAVPYNAPDVLVIDPATGKALRTDFGLDLGGEHKWAGAVLGADNKIYAIPRDSKDILVIDPATGTAARTNMGADLAGSNKWSGGILAPDGTIYGVPRDSLDILIINPAAGTATRSPMGANLTERHKYAEGILAPDGKIYAIPYTRSPEILIIDPSSRTASLSSMGADLSASGWSEAVLGPDGKIYAVPYTASDLLVIDPVAGTASRSEIAAGGWTSTGKWVMGDIVENQFYGIPYGAEEIIRVDLIEKPLVEPEGQ